MLGIHFACCRQEPHCDALPAATQHDGSADPRSCSALMGSFRQALGEPWMHGVARPFCHRRQYEEQRKFRAVPQSQPRPRLGQPVPVGHPRCPALLPALGQADLSSFLRLHTNEIGILHHFPEPSSICWVSQDRRLMSGS